MKLLILNIAGLGWDLWKRNRKATFWNELTPREAQTVFPALTCPVQASLRTARPPEEHGLFLNGRFDRILKKAQFWEQSSSLFQGERVWESFRGRGKTVGHLCWQQSLGRDCDIVLTPQPIHKHHGGMIMDCYTSPAGLYAGLCHELGRTFNLMHYWGPFTSPKSTRWIADAAIAMLQKKEWASDLFMVYLPHMDYDQQRQGPLGKDVGAAFTFLETEVEKIYRAARSLGYDVAIMGDYAITEAHHAIYPNRILREAGYLKMRMIRRMVYADLWRSDAFAMVDHQAAQVVIESGVDADAVRALLESVKGVRRVYRPETGIFPATDWLMEADPGYWFAYPWWADHEVAPDYASHVDIHNKPGFDPCELFTDWWPPLAVTQDTSRIKGTHGNADVPVMFGATGGAFSQTAALLDFAVALKSRLDTDIS